MTAVLTLWALLAAGFSAVACVRLWRQRPAPPVALPPTRVLLLRPLDAPTPLELANLSAPLQVPGVELQHVVLSPFRPRLAPSALVRWLPSDPLSANRKVGHLLYALATVEREAGTVVLAVDADVAVDAALVTSLLQALGSGAQVVSAAPRPEVSATLAGGALRGLLVQTHHSFRALDVMSAGAKAICGKAVALSPRAQAELGALANCIGEDLELSHRLHQRGLSVALAEAPALVPQPPAPSLSAAHQRFTRWMQVLRAHRPALFPTVPLFFSPTPVLLGLAVVAGSWPLWSAVLVLVAARLALAATLDERGGLRFEWLLGELLLLASFASSLWAGQTVTWRGHTRVLRAGGVME